MEKKAAREEDGGYEAGMAGVGGSRGTFGGEALADTMPLSSTNNNIKKTSKNLGEVVSDNSGDGDDSLMERVRL